MCWPTRACAAPKSRKRDGARLLTSRFRAAGGLVSTSPGILWPFGLARNKTGGAWPPPLVLDLRAWEAEAVEDHLFPVGHLGDEVPGDLRELLAFDGLVGLGGLVAVDGGAHGLDFIQDLLAFGAGDE